MRFDRCVEIDANSRTWEDSFASVLLSPTPSAPPTEMEQLSLKGLICHPLLRNAAVCPVCGLPHNFTLLEGAVSVGQDCEYVCPTTGGRGRLRTPQAAEGVVYPPQGSVHLTRQAA